MPNFCYSTGFRYDPNILMELPEEISLKIEEALARNERIASTFSSSFENEDDLPF